MSKLRLTLHKIVGGIKKMSAYWTAFGAMFLPLAFILKIENPNINNWIFIVMLVIGSLGLIIGWINTLRDITQRNKELAYFASAIEGIHKDINTLINEIRQDRNERKQSDTDNHTK